MQQKHSDMYSLKSGRKYRKLGVLVCRRYAEQHSDLAYNEPNNRTCGNKQTCCRCGYRCCCIVSVLQHFVGTQQHTVEKNSSYSDNRIMLKISENSRNMMTTTCGVGISSRRVQGLFSQCYFPRNVFSSYNSVKKSS